jgi:hypothetical protein
VSILAHLPCQARSSSSSLMWCSAIQSLHDLLSNSTYFNVGQRFVKGLWDKVRATLAPNLYFHRAIKREHLFMPKYRVEYSYYPN